MLLYTIALLTIQFLSTNSLQDTYQWPFKGRTPGWSQQNRFWGPFSYNRDSNNGSWHQSDSFENIYSRENYQRTTDASRQGTVHSCNAFFIPNNWKNDRIPKEGTNV